MKPPTYFQIVTACTLTLIFVGSYAHFQRKSLQDKIASMGTRQSYPDTNSSFFLGESPGYQAYIQSNRALDTMQQKLMAYEQEIQRCNSTITDLHKQNAQLVHLIRRMLENQLESPATNSP